MRRIAVFVCLAIAVVVVNTAVARIIPAQGDPEFVVPQGSLVPESVAAKSGTKFRKLDQLKPAPLVLPNIRTVTSALRKTDRSQLRPQLTKSAAVIAFWKNPDHRWILAPRHVKCWGVPWQRSCTVARASLRLHTELAEIAVHRLSTEIPNTNDWQTAVQIVQRIYPGTAQWMLDISDGEGGHGPWVWFSGMCSDPPCLWTGYHLGDDPYGDDAVGGWMQFRYSTFAPWYRAMLKNLKERGITIPDLGWARPQVSYGASTGYGPWLSPLGQALTAGYMRWSQNDGCHWC